MNWVKFKPFQSKISLFFKSLPNYVDSLGTCHLQNGELYYVRLQDGDRWYRCEIGVGLI